MNESPSFNRKICGRWSFVEWLFMWSPLYPTLGCTTFQIHKYNSVLRTNYDSTESVLYCTVVPRPFEAQSLSSNSHMLIINSQKKLLLLRTKGRKYIFTTIASLQEGLLVMVIMLLLLLNSSCIVWHTLFASIHSYSTTMTTFELLMASTLYCTVYRWFGKNAFSIIQLYDGTVQLDTSYHTIVCCPAQVAIIHTLITFSLLLASKQYHTTQVHLTWWENIAIHSLWGCGYEKCIILFEHPPSNALRESVCCLSAYDSWHQSGKVLWLVPYRAVQDCMIQSVWYI